MFDFFIISCLTLFVIFLIYVAHKTGYKDGFNDGIKYEDEEYEQVLFSPYVKQLKKYKNNNKKEKNMGFVSYPKIETPFGRDMDTKKIVKYAWRSNEVEYLKDNDWIWTEKVDGTNIQICWDGHTVTFGGRTENANIPAHLMNYLVDKFGGDVNEEMFEQKFGDTPVILFGEGYGPKINGGQQYRDDVSFILFDVKIGNFWLLRDSVEDIAKFFGIDVVPIVTSEDGFSDIEFAMNYVMAHPKSIVAKNNGKDCYMEGLVGVPKYGILSRNGKRIQVKVKWKDFKEFVGE